MKNREEVRQSRAELHEANERKRLRSSHGERLVKVIVEATGMNFSLEDFQEGEIPFDWPPEIAHAAGLVAAYVSREKASDLLRCFRDEIGSLSGQLGFHDKAYLGVARSRNVDPMSLLAAAEAVEESVIFHSYEPAGVVLVDCYRTQGAEPFTIVVQGEELVRLLSRCLERQA